MSGLQSVLMAVGLLIAVCVVLYALSGSHKDQEGSEPPDHHYEPDPPGPNPYS